MNKTKVRRLDYMGTASNHWYEFKTDKEQIMIEICWVETDLHDKNSLPNLWHKHGWTKDVVNNYLVCDTYVYTKDGCVGKYNPTHTKEHKLDFNWLLEANNTNENKIINEVIKRAKEAL